MDRSKYKLITLIALVTLMVVGMLLDGCKKQSSSSQQSQPKKTQKQLDKAIDDI